MSSYTSLSPDRLMKLVGTPSCPVILDVRTEEDFAADGRLIPASVRRSHADVAGWAPELAGKNAVVICQRGAKLSQGVAAWLRHEGAEAVSLDGGLEAWRSEGLPLVPVDMVPPRDGAGRTLWVTRSRPKIDRIACPWLVRRFVDPSAVFLFVPASDVEGVASRFGATAFDIEGCFWSHRGERCTFDTMITEFALGTPALLRLAEIVRGADTARPELAPEVPGLVAASLGLSRMYSDDLQQLEAGLSLYDAFYRWCRDATDETHNWPTNKVKP